MTRARVVVGVLCFLLGFGLGVIVAVLLEPEPSRCNPAELELYDGRCPR